METEKENFLKIYVFEKYSLKSPPCPKSVIITLWVFEKYLFKIQDCCTNSNTVDL